MSLTNDEIRQVILVILLLGFGVILACCYAVWQTSLQTPKWVRPVTLIGIGGLLVSILLLWIVLDIPPPKI